MRTRFLALLSLYAFALLAMSAGAATDDRKWKPTKQVESHPSGDAITPQMAFDHGGNGMAVWQLSVSGTSHIWASRYTVSDDRWSMPSQLESSTGGGSSPQIAVDANGNAVAVWSQAEGITARVYTISGGWGVTTSLQTVAGSSSSPQVAIDASGNALAVWHQSDGSQNHVWSSHHTLGMTNWDTTQSLDANIGNAVFAQIAMDANGNALAVWRQSETSQSDGSSHTSVWASHYTKNGTPAWGAAKPAESNAGDAVSPQVSFDGAGNARVIWSEFDTDVSRNRIWSSRYTASNDQWSGTASVESNDGDSSAPQVTLDASGNAVAVWYQFDGLHNCNNIWANRFTLSTGLWDSATLIETDNTGDAFLPSIAMDANGSAVVVWQQRQPAPNAAVSGIWAALYTPGNAVFANSWVPAALIESDNRGSALAPRVALDINGSAIAVWYQSDGTRSNINSARFTNEKRWLAPSPLVTDGSGQVDDQKQIVFDANGNALAVWLELSSPTVRMRSRYFTPASGTWSPVALISGAGRPQVAFDANGNGLAVWEQPVNGRPAIMASHYSPTGNNWTAPETLNANGATGRAQSLAVGSNASGVVLAVWQQVEVATPNVKTIWSRRYTSGWTGPEQIGTTDAAFKPLVAVDANGNGLATWPVLSGVNHVLFWNRNNGAAWGSAAAVGTGSVSGQEQLSFDANGNALIMWHLNGQIWATRYSGGFWGASQNVKAQAGSAFDERFAFDSNGVPLAIWSQDDSLDLWYNRPTATGWNTNTAKAVAGSAGGWASRPRLAFGPNGSAVSVWQQLVSRFDVWSANFRPAGAWFGAMPIETDDVHDSFTPEIALDSQGRGIAIWSVISSGSNQNMWFARFE